MPLFSCRRTLPASRNVGGHRSGGVDFECATPVPSGYITIVVGVYRGISQLTHQERNSKRRSEDKGAPPDPQVPQVQEPLLPVMGLCKDETQENVHYGIEKTISVTRDRFFWNDTGLPVGTAMKALKIPIDQSLAEWNNQFLLVATTTCITCLLEAGIPPCFWMQFLTFSSHGYHILFSCNLNCTPKAPSTNDCGVPTFCQTIWIQLCRISPADLTWKRDMKTQHDIMSFCFWHSIWHLF